MKPYDEEKELQEARENTMLVFAAFLAACFLSVLVIKQWWW